MEPMIDAEISYPVTDRVTLALGARDMFDNYPDVNRIDDTNGRTYVDSAVPWQGGYYYGRLSYTF
jgi:iron complex outermembrane receptor protein